LTDTDEFEELPSGPDLQDTDAKFKPLPVESVLKVPSPSVPKSVTTANAVPNLIEF
jgi:hypothetical protein